MPGTFWSQTQTQTDTGSHVVARDNSTFRLYDVDLLEEGKCNTKHLFFSFFFATMLGYLIQIEKTKG